MSSYSINALVNKINSIESYINTNRQSTSLIANNSNNGATAASGLIYDSNNNIVSNGTSNLLSGYNNIALGNLSLYKNEKGCYNIAFSRKSLVNNTSGSYNIGIGFSTLNNVENWIK